MPATSTTLRGLIQALGSQNSEASAGKEPAAIGSSAPRLLCSIHHADQDLPTDHAHANARD